MLSQYLVGKATDKKRGVLRFGTNAEVTAGLLDNVAVSAKDVKDIAAPDATTVVKGVVKIKTDGTLAGADDTTVPTSLATKTYADALAIAGAPDASESVKGIAELADTAQAIAGTDDARIMTPKKVADVFAAPFALGSGTPAAGAFTTLSKAGAGSTWEITVVKNAQGYNDWTSVAASDGAQAATPAPSAINSPKAAVGAPRSTYETPEERAQRQVLIVRQSSLNVALGTLSVGAKTIKPDDVIALAKVYENYVFDVKDPGPSGFEDIPDFDVPTVD